MYGLVVGKNGHKLQPAPKDRDCGEQHRRDHRYELGATSLSGHCHAFVPGGREAMLSGQGVDMSDLAEMLSIWAGRIVVDKTAFRACSTSSCRLLDQDNQLPNLSKKVRLPAEMAYGTRCSKLGPSQPCLLCWTNSD